MFAGPRAKVAELADAPDLGSGGRKAMGVRLPPFAHLRSPHRASLGVRSRAKRRGASASAVRSATCRAEAELHAPSTLSEINEDRIHRRQRNAEEPRRRNPEHGRRRRDRQGRARLQQGGADSRVPARQGAGEGRAPALPRSDPARRRARADPARGRRGAARARRRAGRHARHHATSSSRKASR